MEPIVEYVAKDGPIYIIIAFLLARLLTPVVEYINVLVEIKQTERDIEREKLYQLKNNRNP